MAFGVTSGYCTTGCTTPGYAFVGLSAVLAGHGGTAEGEQRSIWVCWLLEDDLSSLKWLFHINTYRIPGKSQQRLKGASPWMDSFVPAAVCLMHL